MPIPPVVVIVVPIAMPLARVLGEDVIMSGANVADCPISSTSFALREPIAMLALQLRDAIATMALHLSEPVGLDRSAVLELCKTIVSATAERSRRKLVWNDRTVSA